MNILLVYPEFPDTFWSFKHALKFVRKKAGAPPLGLLTVAAMLPSKWAKRLVDLNVTSLTQKDLAGADYVFVSAMIVQRDSARALIARCKQAGVKVVAGGFIVGFDSDTPSIFQQQIDFIQRSGIVTAMVGLLQAPPGTRLYERLQQEGRLVNEMSGDNVDGSTNIVPKMGLEALRQGYRQILDQIYAPQFYYERVLTFLREYQPPKIRVHLELQYVLALGRSIYQLGIRGVERAHYWRLFFWTLFRRPRLFPLAITLAIYGFHFRQVIALRVS